MGDEILKERFKINNEDYITYEAELYWDNYITEKDAYLDLTPYTNKIILTINIEEENNFRDETIEINLENENIKSEFYFESGERHSIQISPKSVDINIKENRATVTF